MLNLVEQLYLEDFSSWEEVISAYQLSDHKTEPKYVLASYSVGGYEGSSIVIFGDSIDNLSFVHGSHCSCYGLEGQWDPEDTPLKSLIHMASEGEMYGIDKVQAMAWLMSLEA